jgi:hypothetical protein
MLILLTPEQVSSNWDFISAYVVDAGPLEYQATEDKYNNILNGILCGDMQCWVEAEADSKGWHIQAVVLTQILENSVVGIKNLLIYSLVGVDDLFDNKKWASGLLTLVKFAKSKGCANIIGYTSNARLLKIAERLKADTSQRVAVFPIK